MEKIRDYYPVHKNAQKRRCSWASGDLLTAYHDDEYGIIKTTNDSIFEQICLEVFCKGHISLPMIEKRNALKEALCDYNITAITALSDDSIQKMAKKLSLPVAKLLAVRTNAQGAQKAIEDTGSLFKFIYAYQQPDRLLFALKRYGFTQVGISTITGLMKNLGILEAHEAGCYKKTIATEE